MQVYTRSNWKWYCKQVIYVPKTSQGLASLVWLKKSQLFMVFANGRVEFLEFQAVYNSSNSTCNQINVKELAYTAVVDGPTIHLTPLGKFVMPPPMSEKQVLLPSFAQCLSMYGHRVCAYSELSQELYTFDCDAGQSSLTKFKLPLAGKVTSLFNFVSHQDEYVVLVVSSPTNDQVALFKLASDGPEPVGKFDTQGKV